MKSLLAIATGVATCVVMSARLVQAFNGETHKAMNIAATSPGACSADFCFDDFLRNDLALGAGIEERFGGETVWQWIRDGGEHEDDPDSRSFRHFHDPLRPWNDAGLQLIWPPFFHWESSVVWMQDDDGTDADANGAAQGWSWPDARRSYYHALTMQYQGDREQKWADTFRAVGQVMHLIEDAASPAHVRNNARRM